MPRLLVAGLINVETTLRVDGFPIEYAPVHYPFFGIAAGVSGVGYNVAKALAALGQEVELLSLIGDDWSGAQVRAALAALPLRADGVLALLPQTCQSVILFDPSGRRQIHTDLKEIQERAYPAAAMQAALERADAHILCNINFVRPHLAAARATGKPIATDVHALADLDDAYNADFLRAARILFQSHERLPLPPEAWARELLARYPAEIVVIGLGAEGALLAVRADGFVGRFPARPTRPVVSTIGAGDALFACFVDGYLRTRDPYAALRRALLFASWKIGVASAGEGYLSSAALAQLEQQV